MASPVLAKLLKKWVIGVLSCSGSPTDSKESKPARHFLQLFKKGFAVCPVELSGMESGRFRGT